MKIARALYSGTIYILTARNRHLATGVDCGTYYRWTLQDPLAPAGDETEAGHEC